MIGTLLDWVMGKRGYSMKPYIFVKQNKRKEFYALLIGSNGKVIWKTSESYKRKRGVQRAIEILKQLCDARFSKVKY